jgi:osmoprotectant transport system permease protein
MIADIADYISTHSDQLGTQITTHIGISLFALVVAVLIGVPCGYFASKSAKSEALVTAPFEILRVVPSLAVLILLIPIMGTGVKPAVTALTILAIPPVLLNTAVGFRSIPDFMVESARGIGMTEREMLFKVRIPGALPMMLAGIRTALVEIVASTTLAAKIGGGGLGEIIFTGLGLNRTDMLVLGGLLVAALSLLSGVIFDVITRRLLRYKYV